MEAETTNSSLVGANDPPCCTLLRPLAPIPLRGSGKSSSQTAHDVLITIRTSYRKLLYLYLGIVYMGPFTSFTVPFFGGNNKQQPQRNCYTNFHRASGLPVSLLNSKTLQFIQKQLSAHSYGSDINGDSACGSKSWIWIGWRMDGWDGLDGLTFSLKLG